MEDKSISERLTDLENKIDRLVNQEKPTKYISQTDLLTFHNRIRKILPEDGIVPYRIVISEKFSDCMQHKMLYPDYNTGVWRLLGHTSEDSTPFIFEDIPKDFLVECLIGGNFPE